jgi:hypothetical protein
MSFDDLSEKDKKLYDYIKMGNFHSKKWSTPDAAAKLGMTEEEVYNSLSNLARHVKDNIWIYYEDGAMRVVAE